MVNTPAYDIVAKWLVETVNDRNQIMDAQTDPYEYLLTLCTELVNGEAHEPVEVTNAYKTLGLREKFMTVAMAAFALNIAIYEEGMEV